MTKVKIGTKIVNLDLVAFVDWAEVFSSTSSPQQFFEVRVCFSEQNCIHITSLEPEYIEALNLYSFFEKDVETKNYFDTQERYKTK